MRAYVGALVALAAGAIAVLVSYGAVWATATAALLSGDGAPTSQVEFTGRELVPLGAAMGWVALAGVAGVIATARWGRRVVGAVLVLAGGVAGVSAVAFALTDVAAGGGAFVEAAAAGRGLGQVSDQSISAWWLLAVAGALAILAVGMALLLAAGRLPALSRRYERSTDARGTASDGTGRAVGGVAMWDALDRGEDPTKD